MFAFTYDAWNRLVKVTKAYRDPDNSYALTANLVVDEIAYDGLHRRVVKQVKNSGPLDCTYHYYYDGQRIVETHNGSEQVIQQFVWGQTYIDELVQIGLNDDPNDATEDDVETFRFALHNANYNVIGLVDDTGAMVERYEYTPYGERQVYTSAGLNDPDCYAPIKKSQRVQIAGIDQPWGLNPVEHQGLFHDQETGLTNNRYRILHSRLGRYIQRDPLGYVDGMNGYAYVRSNPYVFVDHNGFGAYRVGKRKPRHPQHDPGAGAFDSETMTRKEHLAYNKWEVIARSAIAGPLDDAGNHMLHYLKNEGAELTIDAAGMVSESPPAKAYFFGDLNDAMAFVETLDFSKNKTYTIIFKQK